MKLTIAVTDACIFIDLFDLDLIASFFNLELEVHTTVAVYLELYAEQQQVLKEYQSAERLIIHNLEEEDFIEIFSVNYPKSLSETDKSVLHVANKLNACVLSSDKVLRNCAKNRQIEYHGMIWIFDELVKSTILTKEMAAIKLKELVASNCIFRNNKQLADVIVKRLKLWSE